MPFSILERLQGPERIRRGPEASERPGPLSHAKNLLKASAQAGVRRVVARLDAVATVNVLQATGMKEAEIIALENRREPNRPLATKERAGVLFDTDTVSLHNSTAAKIAAHSKAERIRSGEEIGRVLAEVDAHIAAHPGKYSVTGVDGARIAALIREQVVAKIPTYPDGEGGRQVSPPHARLVALAKNWANRYERMGNLTFQAAAQLRTDMDHDPRIRWGEPDDVEEGGRVVFTDKKVLRTIRRILAKESIGAAEAFGREIEDRDLFDRFYDDYRTAMLRFGHLIETEKIAEAAQQAQTVHSLASLPETLVGLATGAAVGWLSQRPDHAAASGGAAFAAVRLGRQLLQGRASALTAVGAHRLAEGLRPYVGDSQDFSQKTAPALSLSGN